MCMKRFIQQDSFRHRDDTVMTYRNELYSVYAFETTREEGMEVQFGKICVEGNPWNNREVLCVVNKQEYIEHEGNSRSFAGQSSSSQTYQSKKLHISASPCSFPFDCMLLLPGQTLWGVGQESQPSKWTFFCIIVQAEKNKLGCMEKYFHKRKWEHAKNTGETLTFEIDFFFFLQNQITMPFLHVFNEKFYWW